MKNLTVLGAGYMGSALCFPLSESVEQIRLWGTWLDDDLVASSVNGKHPKLQKELPLNVELFYSDSLKESLSGSELVIMAVSSEGFVSVFDRLLAEIDPETPILSLTKGFIDTGSEIEQISRYAGKKFRAQFPGSSFKWGSIGGPVKAIELSDKIPTHSVYGLKPEFPVRLINDFPTGYYRVSLTEDVSGVEICSALKNAYAIALGICDGMYDESDIFYDNIKAFFISHSVLELAEIVDSAGGLRATSNYLAGAGDIYVTAQSGRNKTFGKYIGKGVPPRTALEKMLEKGDIAEGFYAVRHAEGFLSAASGKKLSDFPLLDMLNEIIFRDVSAEKAVRRFIDSAGTL